MSSIERRGEAPAPDRRHLRRFGLALGSGLTLVGTLLWWNERPAFAYVLPVAAALLLAGLLAPRLLTPLEAVFARLARLVTAALTHVLLTLFYFLVMTPLGLVIRLLRRDPLGRRFDPELPTYWVPVEPDGPASRPEKPY